MFYNSAVNLNNFDKLIEDKFKNIISVNQTNFNNLSTPAFAFQYFLEFKGLSTEYWSDSGHSDDAAEKYASNFVKVLSTTIPMLDIEGKVKPNQYLGMNGIYLLGTLIKKKNNDSTIANFQDSPKENLQKFLVALKKDGDLKYKPYIDSLYKYLYHSFTLSLFCKFNILASLLQVRGALIATTLSIFLSFQYRQGDRRNRNHQ